MNGNLNKGHYAERQVAEMLRKKGCIIDELNYRSKYGEIDIIAETAKYILFIEVKLRKQDSLVSPAEAIDYKKKRRIILTAEDYMQKSKINFLQPRFDTALITEFDKNGKKTYKVEYICNAFMAD